MPEPTHSSTQGKWKWALKEENPIKTEMDVMRSNSSRLNPHGQLTGTHLSISPIAVVNKVSRENKK